MNTKIIIIDPSEMYIVHYALVYIVSVLCLPPAEQRHNSYKHSFTPVSYPNMTSNYVSLLKVYQRVITKLSLWMIYCPHRSKDLVCHGAKMVSVNYLCTYASIIEQKPQESPPFDHDMFIAVHLLFQFVPTLMSCCSKQAGTISINCCKPNTMRMQLCQRDLTDVWICHLLNKCSVWVNITFWCYLNVLLF